MALRQVMVVAGEASADRHAGSLIAQLTKRLPDTRFFGMGGPHLEGAGLERIYPADEVAVMGTTEVLPKLRRILRVMRGLERTAFRRRPSCAILVDLPDFNLRLARRLKRHGIPVVYFISPKIWAWRKYRIHQIASWVDLMLCILPFEESLYRRAGVRARYVGNPVLDQLPSPGTPLDFRRQLKLSIDRPTLALLPGSRNAELKRILPAMVQAARQIAVQRPGLQVVVPVAPSIQKSQVLSQFSGSMLEPVLLDGHAPEAVGASDIAVVASGTATLEAALINRPLVVVYRMAPISYLIGRLLVRVPHVSLVNLIAEKNLVPELLQGAMTPERIAAEVDRLWSSPSAQQAMIRGFDELRHRLGPKGASVRAAEEIASLLGG